MAGQRGFFRRVGRQRQSDRVLLDHRPDLAIAIGPEKHNALIIAGGQEHPLRLLAAKHCFFQVVDNHDLPPHQLLGGIMAADSGNDLLAVIADIDFQNHQFVGIGVLSRSENGGDS